MSAWLKRVRAALAPKGYDVERELASGGMGTVFLVRDVRLEGPVAIKVLRPGLWTRSRGDPPYRARADGAARRLVTLQCKAAA